MRFHSKLFAFVLLGFPVVALAQAAPEGSPVDPGAAPTSGVARMPRVFLQSASKGNNRNSYRDQSSEMAKDFDKECPEVKITINQARADYTVTLNHIESGFVRDNQFEVYDADGDRIKGKEGGSIKNGVKGVCSLIAKDWAAKVPASPSGR